ncbi:hypothetical protein [Roseateles saccharophilus]|uniref:Outer membrane beta-barrel porin/alpha-amylase n=1 Tax=Roseateles saccharophilus TaxID=304 RepID=A0A4R3UFA7_ROSSA|nr:hypothetical protein [Roseateles saccharophilus]MDG0835208.1 hypothetical protein [Roseateles saccharophilus]TCU87140.1 hypothetical protein EV671_104412 [Roseateles saccharophilus]
MTSLQKTAIAAALATALPAAWACSSCGCTLSSDWASQGLYAASGLSLDLRHDYFNQDELRSGSHRVDRAGIPLPADQEIQRNTANHISTLTLDYGFSPDWAVTLQLPYLLRSHATVAQGDTELSTSRSSGIGDVRVLARYQGDPAERHWGLQFGLKLPTGRTDQGFAAGPQAGQPLDRGLQPGTGSTDLLLGAYRFGTVATHFDYFAQALLQLPLQGKDGFKPGAGLNLSLGLRYVGDGPVAPQLQLNLRSERRESGVNADTANAGSTLAYLSPGLTATLSEQLKAYAFIQLPVYQHVNGLQIEPRFSASVGLHYAY